MNIHGGPLNIQGGQLNIQGGSLNTQRKTIWTNHAENKKDIEQPTPQQQKIKKIKRKNKKDKQ
jgi:hypothetical protein